MPYSSKKQMRFFHAAEAKGDLPKGTARKWDKHTPQINNLPESTKSKKEARLINLLASLPNDKQQKIATAILTAGYKDGVKQAAQRAHIVKLAKLIPLIPKFSYQEKRAFWPLALGVGSLLAPHVGKLIPWAGRMLGSAGSWFGRAAGSAAGAAASQPGMLSRAGQALQNFPTTGFGQKAIQYAEHPATSVGLGVAPMFMGGGEQQQ